MLEHGRLGSKAQRCRVFQNSFAVAHRHWRNGRIGQVDLEARAHVEPYQTLGLLTSDEMRRAGVEGLYDWALAADDVRHAFRRHGDPATEARLGQLAVTADDFRLAAIALRDGQWRLDGTTDIGRPAIVLEYSHPQSGIRYVMVWEVRAGRKMIVLKSMRKSPAPGAPRP